MATLPLPSIETISNSVTPDLGAGLVFWKPRDASEFTAKGRKSAAACAKTWNTRFAGKPAFNVKHSSGYRFGYFQGRHIYAHRLIWALKHGEWPDGEVDHINRIASDNRIENLRIVTSSQNKRNRTRSGSLEHARIGVVEVGGRFRAVISAERQRMHIGYFDTERDALLAYDFAARLIDGEFARVNLSGG